MDGCRVIRKQRGPSAEHGGHLHGAHVTDCENSRFEDLFQLGLKRRDRFMDIQYGNEFIA